MNAHVDSTADVIASNSDRTTPFDRDCHGRFTSAGNNLIGRATGCAGFTDGVGGDRVTDQRGRNRHVVGAGVAPCAIGAYKNPSRIFLPFTER